MPATDTNPTTITADPTVPLVRITREFDAPPAKVFRQRLDELLGRPQAQAFGPPAT